MRSSAPCCWPCSPHSPTGQSAAQHGVADKNYLFNDLIAHPAAALAMAFASSGSCTDINYDPLLSARSAAYALSFTLRAGEKQKKAASAVTERDVAAGGTR
jgi:hypothetical protein